MDSRHNAGTNAGNEAAVPEPPTEWLAALKAKWNEREGALAGFAAMKSLVQCPVKEGPI